MTAQVLICVAIPLKMDGNWPVSATNIAHCMHPSSVTTPVPATSSSCAFLTCTSLRYTWSQGVETTDTLPGPTQSSMHPSSVTTPVPATSSSCAFLTCTSLRYTWSQGVETTDTLPGPTQPYMHPSSVTTQSQPPAAPAPSSPARH